METEKWFAVRTLYEHEDLKRGRERLFEERIVLFRAGSSEEAITKAETGAQSYAANLDHLKTLDYVMAFELFDPPGENAEVFSLMRESRLTPDRYIDRFFDTGKERSQDI
jgi:Domain of unknown function (DUF4288)